MVKNRVGVASAGFLLTVKLPTNMPKAPKDIQVDGVTTSKILVSWKPPPFVGNAQITAYIINYFEVGETPSSCPQP